MSISPASRDIVLAAYVITSIVRISLSYVPLLM